MTGSLVTAAAAHSAGDCAANPRRGVSCVGASKRSTGEAGPQRAIMWRPLPGLLCAITITVIILILGSCTSAPDTADTSVARVVTYNVGDVIGVPPTTGSVMKVLANAPWADVYVFQEVWDYEHLNRLYKALNVASGREYEVSYSRAMRLAVFSVAALRECRAYHPGEVRGSYGTLLCRTSVGERELAVAGLHLPPLDKERGTAGNAKLGVVSATRTLFSETFFSNMRSRYARRIHRWLSTWDTETLVVAGDFNTVPFTKTIRYMNRHYNDVLAGSGDYLSGTYWRVGGAILPRVDFIFHSADLSVADAQVIREKAGDHFPVYAELQFAPDVP